MVEHPRITLVTPSYNQGGYLEETIDSVLSQSYPDLEYYVMDGGSNDNSVEIIRKYSKYLTGWVSEPDHGQSHAIKKGLDSGSGVLANWINSDDVLLPGALQAVADAWEQSGSDLIIGRDLQFSSDVHRPIGHFTGSGYRFPECLRFWDGEFKYHQPPTFFSMRAYKLSGGIDTKLQYVMDFDLYTRLLSQRGVRVQYIDEVVSGFRIHQEAKTSRAKAAFLTELRRVSRSHWPTNWNYEAEQSAMDRYCAECSIFQAAANIRGRQPRLAFSAILNALRYSPGRAVSLIASRSLGTHER